MVSHVPGEKSKTVIFWLEHEVQYVYRLYKKNFQIPSVGQGGKGRGKVSHCLYKLKFSAKFKLRRRLRIRQQICSPKSTHFFEIPLVPGQYIHKHSGNAKIFDFFGTVRKLGPKNQKRVNFRSFFQKFQMWIVLFWLNLHD